MRRPTWNLYEFNLGRNEFFCCPSGQYGVLPISGDAGICKPTNEPVASSLVATPATQYGGGSVATTMVGGGGAASPTTTLTKTSTLNGGGVTTIVTAVGGSASTATATSGSGSSGSSSGSGISKSTKKSKLSIGAIVGIAIAGVVLILAILCFCFWKRHSAKKSKGVMGPSTQMPYVGGSGGGYEGQQSGAAVPSPYDAREHKSLAVGVQGRQYSGEGMGYGGTPPPQQGYGHTPPPPMQQAMYGPPPVEAPQRWEGRAEMEAGRREI